MKLSFSTNRWRDISFERFLAVASEYNFDAI